MPRPMRRWTVLLGALTMLVVSTVVVLGARAGTSGSNAPHTPPSAVVQSDAPRPIAVGRQEENRHRVADSGEPLDAHLVMLEQMRVNVTPQMVQTMNARPLVPTLGDLAELERHAADIDRMLARNS